MHNYAVQWEVFFQFYFSVFIAKGYCKSQIPTIEAYSASKSYLFQAFA